MKTIRATIASSLSLMILACQASPSPSAEALPAQARQAPTTPKAPASAEAAGPSKASLYAELDQYVSDVVARFDSVPADRRRQLEKLALFVKTKISSGEPANLTFICTHNSRRSHMGQLWAATAAAYYGVEGVKTFSGGTESTAFNPRAVAAMKRAGFEVEPGSGDNPHYQVSFSKDADTQECFSKKYDDPSNPSDNFAAVMTCSRADKNCPTVRGASLRVAIPYVDPKVSDGSPEEATTYDERAKQIATEMFYLFSRIRPRA